jgi:hypothetical protein
VADFAHCRPIVSVDATFLIGKYKGTLMVAIGMTAENQLLPLAFALVEGENNESWSWFLRLVKNEVLGLDRSICMISNRHRSLLNGAKDPINGYPPLIHRWCYRPVTPRRSCRPEGQEDDGRSLRVAHSSLQHVFEGC